MYVWSLDYEQAPDYEFLKRLFLDFLKERQSDLDYSDEEQKQIKEDNQLKSNWNKKFMNMKMKDILEKNSFKDQSGSGEKSDSDMHRP